MLARGLQTIIFIFLIIGIQQVAVAAEQQTILGSRQNTVDSISSQKMAANPTLPIKLTPTVSGGTACSDVANQIRKVSEISTSDKVYPWEDLPWLEKNLGKPKFVKIRENKIYMWICINPSGGTSMIMYLVVDKLGVEHVLHQSMICRPNEPCSAYGFERSGNKITELVVTPKEI